jgi:hypothetical protein
LVTKNDVDDVLARPTPNSCIHFDGIARAGFEVRLAGRFGEALHVLGICSWLVLPGA